MKINEVILLASFDIIHDFFSLIEPNISIVIFIISGSISYIVFRLFNYNFYIIYLMALFFFLVIIPYMLLLIEYYNETKGRKN